ncbi:YbgC/FadM family acyl-CoA thioesterase [Sphingomonas bacterium]|uniref:YbgC/FadM family acyl-CoA thioesterase n=1 Tax=Sphingomonas bacterium TaxID=1895847 RepID=UPI00157607CA|nr:YbgC/FadM family acyl-CoA thioesterase [Sphingomonas bacterium]
MTPAGPDLPSQGRLDGPEHRYPVRVYFEDTDVSGVAYHANYLRWMERARTEMLRCAGIDHGGSIAGGEGGYAVASVAIRYRAPARLDDALFVDSRLMDVRAASIAIQQTVRRGAVVLAEADLVAAFVAPDGRPRRQPRAWCAIYQRLLPPDAVTRGHRPQGDA